MRLALLAALVAGCATPAAPRDCDLSYAAVRYVDQNQPEPGPEYANDMLLLKGAIDPSCSQAIDNAYAAFLAHDVDAAHYWVGVATAEESAGQ